MNKKKILIAGAGGAPSEGVIRSLQNREDFEVIGMGSEPMDLAISAAERKYLVPYCYKENYKSILLGLLNEEKPDLIHFQNDLEVFEASKFRDEIEATGTKVFMPDHEVIDTCVHKYKSYLRFQEAGVKVPKNIMIHNEEDLKRCFEELGDESGNVWFRASSIGGGGKGSIPSNDYSLVKAWIDRNDGWGDFVGAEMLTPETVTWLSVWNEGKLIVAQTRERKGWTHGNRSASGVTGVTKVGVTASSELVNKVAIDTIHAVTDKPHGIFGVDMAYDKQGHPNPTEINISRFFTTVRFFTEAGLNMPEIFADIAISNKVVDLEKKINPLQDDLCWLRGMDTEPRLFKYKDIEKAFKKIS